MKTRLVFVRHGESTGNLNKRMYGHYDGPLTEKGVKQAELTAEYLKDWHFDAAVSSDLQRAYATCMTILKYHPDTPVTRDSGIRETYIGIWENAPRAEIAEKYPEEFRTWAEDIWNARPTGGESVQECTRRMEENVWRIAREHWGETVLVTGHAMVFRTLCCKWLGVPYERMQEIPWLSNASVTVVDYDLDSNSTEVIMFDEAGFQGDMRTTVRPFSELK